MTHDRRSRVGQSADQQISRSAGQLVLDRIGHNVACATVTAVWFPRVARSKNGWIDGDDFEGYVEASGRDDLYFPSLSGIKCAGVFGARRRLPLFLIESRCTKQQRVAIDWYRHELQPPGNVTTLAAEH